MLKLYVLDRVPGLSDALLLQLMTSTEARIGGLFQQQDTASYRNMARFVSDPHDADLFVLPHQYSKVAGNTPYLRAIDAYVRAHDRPVLVLAYGDGVQPVTLHRAITLRSGQYRSKLGSQEHIVPAFVEDLGAQYPVSVRPKEALRPSVGFTGWVTFGTRSQEAKYRIKVGLGALGIAFGLQPPASLQGLYYRRHALRVLQESPRVEARFRERSSFSGHARTVSGDPAVMRREFVDAVTGSDLSLAIRGDGNWSMRFYEILSLGRVPLYVDTNAVLPLEDEVAYDRFIVRVNYTDLDHIADIVAERWARMSDEEYRAMQEQARQVFVTQLRADRFYQRFFERLRHVV